MTLLRLAVGVGLLWYLVHSKIVDLHALSRIVGQWPITLAALTIFVVDFALMAWRLCLLLRPQGMRLPFRTSLELTLVSSFFATFLPGRAGGDLARLYYATKENREQRPEIVTVLLLDRGIGLFSLLLLPLLVAPLFRSTLHIEVGRILLMTSASLAFGMLGVFLIFLVAPSLMARLAEGSLGPLRWRGILRRCLDTTGAYSRNLGTLAAALGIAITDNLMVVAVTALAVLAINPAGLSAKLCLVVPMGEIVNSLPITPGGLGVGEAAFDALFKTVGLQGGAETVLCWRIWNVLASLLGLPFYLRGFEARVFAENCPATNLAPE